MKTWNVLTGVVQLVDADTAEQARRIADNRVRDAVNEFGDLYPLEEGVGDVVFESEPLP